MPLSEKARNLILNKRNVNQDKLSRVDPFLPGKERVEGVIESREDVLSATADDLSRVDLSQFLVPGIGPAQKVATSALNVAGGLIQRGTAGAANVADVLQTGDVNRSIPEEFLKGVKGERLGNLGDPIRRLSKRGGKLNEAFAVATDFLVTAGALNLATKGQLVSGANKMANSAKTTAVRAARRGFVKRTRENLQRFKIKAETFKKGVDEAFSSMKQEFEKIYSKIGRTGLDGDDFVDLNDITVRLVKGDPRVTNNLKKLSELSNDVRVSSRSGVVLQPNINTASLIQREIGRSVPRKVWNGFERATPQEAQLINDYFKLGEIIAKNANKGQSITQAMIKGGSDPRSMLLRLNAKQSRLHNLNQKIRPLLQSPSGRTRTVIKGITKSEAKKGVRQAEFADLQSFSKEFFKQGKDILKEIDNINKRTKVMKGVKSGLKKAGLIGLGVFEAERLIGASRQPQIITGVE